MSKIHSKLHLLPDLSVIWQAFETALYPPSNLGIFMFCFVCHEKNIGIVKQNLLLYKSSKKNLVNNDQNSKKNYFLKNLFYWVFVILFIQYYSVICRPSDHTGEAPGRESNPGRTAQRQGHYPLTTTKFTCFILVVEGGFCFSC